jgi:formate dehydrogenase beta subunit
MTVSRREFLKVAGLGLGGAVMLPTKGALASSGAGDADHDICMLYDSTKCVGCNACTNACREWNRTTDERDPTGLYDAPTDLSGDTWTLIKLYQGQGEHAFVKRQCMHCLDPACVSACPVQALQKKDDGPVVYYADHCIGCRYCMVACPFNIPRFEWDEVIPRIVKCTLCRDRLFAGHGTACAEACPTGALIWGPRGELLAEAENRLMANPDRYINYIYGRDDAGGTLVLYLSHVPFEKLGLPKLDSKPAPELSEAVATFGTPSALLAVAGALTGIYWSTKRQAEK